MTEVSAQTSAKKDINVVPMIDVMLVLLIIFMIVTPLIAAGFQATMPWGKNLESRPEEDGDIVLGIDQDGRYYLDPGSGSTGIVPEGTLEQTLRAIYDRRTKDKIIFLKAHSELEYSHIQDAIEIARLAGVRVLAAITEERRVLRGEERGGR